MKGVIALKKIKDAYIGYRLVDGSEAGIMLHTMKNVNPMNSYKLDYVRYIANAFNFLLGRVAYYNKTNNFKISAFAKKTGRTDGYIDTVIITDKDLANNIGCSVNHSSIVMGQIRDLFGLEVKREKYRGGARTIRMNAQLIDFLKVYTEDDLSQYIIKHDLTDNKLIVALQQVFKYRVWAIKDSQLNNETRAAKKSFIARFRDYFHRVTTSSKSNQIRINIIRNGKHLLTEKELLQLDVIIDLNSQGRLDHYWFTTLIKLEQKVLLHGIDTSDKKDDQKHSLTNGNQIEGESVEKAAASMVAQKIPGTEDNKLSDQELQEFQSTWNNIADKANEIPRIEILTAKRIQSINELVKIHSKENFKKAVDNISNLKLDKSKSSYSLTFERFMKDEVFTAVLSATSTDNWGDVEIPWLKRYLQEEL